MLSESTRSRRSWGAGWGAATLAFALNVSTSARAAEPTAAASAGQLPAAPVGKGNGPTAAQKESARTWLREGYELLEQKQQDAALERFTAAYGLVPVPTTGLAVARAEEGLGRWVEANDRAIEVINMPHQPGEPEVFAAARADAQALWDRLSPLVPSVRIDVAPPTAPARLAIDGAEMPTDIGGMFFKLNPGEHRLELSAAGYLPVERTFTLDAKEQQQLAIILTPTLPSAAATASGGVESAAHGEAASGDGPDTAQGDAGAGARTRGYVALGVASVAVLTGSISGIMAITSKPDCPNDNCDISRKDDADTSKTYGNVATVSFGVAGLAAAYALWELLANAPSDAATSASARPGISPIESGALLGVSGRF